MSKKVESFKTYRLNPPPRSNPPGRLYSQLAGRPCGMRSSSGEAVKQPVVLRSTKESISNLQIKEIFIKIKGFVLLLELYKLNLQGVDFAVHQNEAKCMQEEIHPSNSELEYGQLLFCPSKR